MKNVYRNFDALDMAFHGYMPPETVALLDEAKKAAAEAGEPVAIDLCGVLVKVMETGRRGGWHYVLDTGEDGEVWAIKDAPRDGLGNWNITASPRGAAFLQFGGAEAVFGRMTDRLKAWGFVPTRCPKSGRYDSVSRVDYAADFLTDRDFAIDPACVASKGSKTGYLEGASAFWSGRRVTGITVGKMPGRQVVIYDKTADTRAKKKHYWFAAWGVEPDTESRVWRVELRAGKKYLADQWGVRSFADLMACIGDIVADTLHKVRYIELTDSNVTRCPDAPLWVAVRDAVARGLKEKFAGLVPGLVKQVVREQWGDTMKKLIKGAAITFAAVDGGRVTLPGLMRHVGAMAESVIRQIQIDADAALDHAKRAQNRYRLIEVSEWEKQTQRHSPPWQTA